MREKSFFLSLVALLFLQGCAALTPEPPAPAADAVPAPFFAEVSRAAGITDNRRGTVKATGQAWGDYDNDGWPDLYVTDTDGPNTLYHNEGDGTFTVSPLSEQVALPEAESTGVTFADFDNDGWVDLYVTARGTNTLFRNREGQGFEDVTRSAGLADPLDGKSSAWGDFDNDGDLDLYVTNWSCYPDCGRPFYGDSDHLYRNNGDGTFENVTRLLGAQTMGAGHAASFLDYDNDGDLDIYLVNDQYIYPIGNVLWRNDGPGCEGWCFTEVSEAAGADRRVMGMGIASADYDNDGDLDIYFTNAGPMTLLRNNGDGTFENVAPAAGVEAPDSVAWGAVFLDYDNDGWRDLYLAVPMMMDAQALPGNQLFRNRGDGTFERLRCNTGAADVGGTIGIAYADYDRDGRMDFVIGNHIEGYRLYRNQGTAGAGNHWLGVQLTGGGPVNRDAVGARVYLRTADGLTRMAEVTNGSSMGSGNELLLHFGLGAAEEAASLTVRWPDGLEQTFEKVAADQFYSLAYPVDGATRLTPICEHCGSTVPLPEADAEVAQPPQFPASVDPQLAALLADAGAGPLPPPELAAPEVIALGEMLYWDPILSGNRDTACVTCHHPAFGTGDGLSLPVGTGGRGLGSARTLGAGREFVARNATPVYNLGYPAWETLFWDGRVHGNPLTGFDTPASDRLPEGLTSALAAQALFPVTSRDEMLGDRGDTDIFGNPNELAHFKPRSEPDAIWAGLMARLLAIPAYVDLFHAAYPQTPVEDLGIQHAANAIGAYEAAAFSYLNSPWDAYLRGEADALSDSAKRGAILFYGAAGCAECHSGVHLTDFQYHNMAVPHVGPGKGREEPLDFGRARETGDACDLFAYRTPPLRNVALTGPWMHDGAYTTLEGAVRHMLDPVGSLRNYDPAQLSPELQGMVYLNPEIIERQLTAPSAPAPGGLALSEAQIADLLAFLEALTDPAALDWQPLVPEAVPSGLTVGGE